jgi:hypothetical protein
MKQAIPCFSKFVSSNLYADYVCQKILPKHQLLPSDKVEAQENFKILPILQAFAEISSHVEPTKTQTLQIDLSACNKTVFDKLLQYLPEPKLPSLEAGANGSDVEDDFQFTYIESLLFALHSFGRKNKETFIEDIGGVETMRLFKQRLQYLARGCQNYIKSLQDALKQVPAAEQLKSEENKLKLTALKCIQNINTLIRDLFYPKPDFKSTVTLSWTEAIAPFSIHVKKTPQPSPPSTTKSASTNRPQQSQQQQRRPSYQNRQQNPNKKFRRQ